jgi:hypothetical protein
MFFDPEPCTDPEKLAVRPIKCKNKKSNTDPRLPQHPFFACFVAARASGKTTCLVDLLLHKLKHQFDIIFIWSRSYEHDPTWRAVKLPPGCVFTRWNPDHANSIFEDLVRLSRLKLPGGPAKSLLVMDDMIAEKMMSSSPKTLQLLERVACIGRHFGISACLISQVYKSLSPIVRVNTTNWLLWRQRNQGELHKIAEEQCEHLSTDEFKTLMAHCTSEPFCFMHINGQQQDPRKRYWKNWGECLHLKENKVQ